MPRLIATGEYRPPALGIGTLDRLSRGLVRRLGTHGVVVLRVEPGSGAATAGLRPAQVRGNTIIPGDVVQAIDGREVHTLEELEMTLDRYQPGNAVRVTIWRNGQVGDVSITLQ